MAAWRGRVDCAPPARLQQLREDASIRECASRVSARKGIAEFSDFVEALFTSINAPVALDDLVGVTATLLQVKDEPATSMTGEDRSGTPDVESRYDVACQVEKRIFLERLWDEVLELPLAQRTALLLNLRDEGGRGCIELFPALGVANLRHLAAALEMSAEQLAALWNQLPLDDAAIAQRLSLTRQQVINLRKAARGRLIRRLRGFF